MSREAIIEKVVKVVGFPFSERELSPNLRKQIGELAQRRERLQRLYDKRIELQRTPEAKALLATIVAYLGVLASFFGLLIMLIDKILGTIWIILGLVLFAIAFLTRKHFGVKDRFKEMDMEISHFSKELEEDIASFSTLVFNELSTIHEARVRPTVKHVMVNFAEIVKAIQGKGILLESVECPHCGASLSLPGIGESVKCSHCGKTILAMDIFEKLKGLLS